MANYRLIIILDWDRKSWKFQLIFFGVKRNLLWNIFQCNRFSSLLVVVSEKAGFGFLFQILRVSLTCFFYLLSVPLSSTAPLRPSTRSCCASTQSGLKEKKLEASFPLTGGYSPVGRKLGRRPHTQPLWTRIERTTMLRLSVSTKRTEIREDWLNHRTLLDHEQPWSNTQPPFLLP